MVHEEKNCGLLSHEVAVAAAVSFSYSTVPLPPQCCRNTGGLCGVRTSCVLAETRIVLTNAASGSRATENDRVDAQQP